MVSEFVWLFLYYTHDDGAYFALQSILLGSMDGSIYEAQIDHSGKDR